MIKFVKHFRIFDLISGFAAATFVVQDARLAEVKNLPPAPPEPVTQLDILPVHEVGFTKIVHLCKRLSSKEHIGAGDAVDLRRLVLGQMTCRIGCEHGGLRKQSVEFGKVKQRCRRCRKSSFASMIEGSVRQKHAAAQCAQSLLLPKRNQAFPDRIVRNLGIGVEQEDVFALRLPYPDIICFCKTEIGFVFYDMQPLFCHFIGIVPRQALDAAVIGMIIHQQDLVGKPA